MASLLNMSGRALLGKADKVLFEMYNQYFDGTVNSVANTGIKLWDGTHNKFVMEIVYDKIASGFSQKETLFVVKSDVSPYSGIRVRTDTTPTKSDFVFTISDGVRVLNNEGGFINGSNTYGSHFALNTNSNPHSLIITREDTLLNINYDGNILGLEINRPKTNDLPLLIGCDYKGANETQRYYKGTIHKFVLTEL